MILVFYLIIIIKHRKLQKHLNVCYTLWF